MSWFAELAGKAESLLTNLDEQTGAALRNHHVAKKKFDKNEISGSIRPEQNAGPKRRLTSRSLKKPNPAVLENKIVPGRKTSPVSSQQQAHLQSKDNSDAKTIRSRKSPQRKSQYSLNNSPKASESQRRVVGDAKENVDETSIDSYGAKQRRYSLPTDLELLNDEENWLYKLQNMDIENTMLKNELNVMNREIAELLDRLRRTEDGNDVDSTELTKTKTKLDSTEKLKLASKLESESMTSQMEELKLRLQKLISKELENYREQNNKLQGDIDMLRNMNKDLEEKCQSLYETSKERDSAQIKLENDLRHAQSTIADLQSDLKKSRAECVRLEKDWEAYKLRVKNMLHVKDGEIKSLQESKEFSEDKRKLMEQIDKLRIERDELNDAVISVRGESEEMMVRLQQVEASHKSAERVVAALREALSEERNARNRIEVQYASVTKELRLLQMETGQTIASLRSALRDRDDELNSLRASSSNVRTTDTSALNVADYDVMQDTIDNNKIQYLTQTLVQRQSKIDKLLADNNILRIQLEKLESKYKADVTAVRLNNSHSVVHLQDGDSRHRPRTHGSSDVLSTLSVRIGVMVKRYPIIRIFIIFYMVCLHLWVLTILFTNTPDSFTSRPSRS